MIKRTEKLVITFYTTTDAMNMEQLCKNMSADGRLIPTPSEITADCGLSWCAKTESRIQLENIMKENTITPQGIYLCMV